jgi:hypothetical protein
MELAERLGEEYRSEQLQVERRLAARGMLPGGAKARELADLAVQKGREYTDGRIMIRKDLVKHFPELGTEASLSSLAEELKRSAEARFSSLRDKLRRQMAAAGSIVNINSEFQEEISKLQAEAVRRVAILKDEISLGQHFTASATSISVNTGGGPAFVNTGQIRGDIQQVVGTLNEAGQMDLGTALNRLADAIEGEASLGDERRMYLEQIRFIAQQAAAAPPERQVSAVKGVVEFLRARLQDVANVAQIFAVTAPAVAHHFHFPWVL